MSLKSCSIISLFLFLCCFQTIAQKTKPEFTHADTLRGSNGPGRSFWDVLYYDITINPNFESRTISGKNDMKIRLNAARLLQLDLQEPLILDSAHINQHPITFTREGNVYWLNIRSALPATLHFPANLILSLYYHGKPTEAVSPPWDGGWVWATDKLQRPWMTVACQNKGASVWYPCKDFQGDEPNEGATLRIVCSDSLVGVGNGRLLSVTDTLIHKKVYTWRVVNPINNYCIVPYIGKYVHWGENYPGLKGNLSMDYWVLEQDLKKAKNQFTQAPEMMKAYEYWFGAYPFYEDGYKLVQSSYLGMEHQSDIAYGNHFNNGYLGSDLSGTGWGLKWDFIIVHESGHEWFGNNITTADIADMWVHEGFTTYAEALFTEYYYGKTAGAVYERGLRKNILNDIPITGKYGVNNKGSNDMYYKASNMIHMIRQMMNNDTNFRMMLTEMNSHYRHKVVTGKEIESFMQNYSKLNLSCLFNQYLHTTKIPVLEYRLSGKKLQYRFSEIVKGFSLLLPVTINGKKAILKTSEKWQEIKKEYSDVCTLKIDPDYLIKVKELTGN